MPSKKSEIDFENQVDALFKGEYKIIGKYVNSTTKVEITHLLCGAVFTALPLNILRGHGCKNCANNNLSKNRRKSNDEFIQEIINLYKGEYIPLEEYGKNSKEKILFKHSICGNVWKISPSNILKGRGCPECFNKRKGVSQKNTTENFSKIVEQESNGKYVLLGEYVNAKTKVSIKHLVCETILEMTPDKFKQGQRCRCSNLSKGEMQITEFLNNKSIFFKFQKTFPNCRNKKELLFDFYLPEYNLCVEYHGEQHYSPIDFAGKGVSWAKKEFLKNTKRDKIKEKYCKDNKIPLIIIPYWEFDNIKEILEKTLSEFG